jgi:1-acyl-sn-glycerol-3-phosphate acyltransferase
MIRVHWRYPIERQILRFLAWVVLKSRGRLRVEGLENVPRRGAAILVGNHIATADPPVIGAQVRRLDLHYIAKAEAFRRPIARFFLRGWNTFPIVRHSSDRKSLERALQVLREGHVLVLFPEGSRSRNATLQRGFPGAGFMALRSGAPVIPVAIFGSEDVLPKGKVIPHSANVTIRFGRPLQIARRRPDGRRVSNQEAVDLILLEVAALLPERYRGVYDGRPLEDARPPTAA